jgi:hypothetical protein
MCTPLPSALTRARFSPAPPPPASGTPAPAAPAAPAPAAPAAPADYEHYSVIVRNAETPGFPTHVKKEFLEMAQALKKTRECPICLDFIPQDALEITPCGHFYCRKAALRD